MPDANPIQMCLGALMLGGIFLAAAGLIELVRYLRRR